MIKKHHITILGSTGSIGTSTLDVLSRHPDRFAVYALTASSQVDLMLAQCAQFKPQVAVMAQEGAGRLLADKIKAEGLPVQVRWGAEALDEVASAPSVDAVMAAIVGAAGLSPCLAAAKAGKRLLLANKEALVVGGDVFLSAVQQGGAVLLPIDSEHSAIFQSLPEDPATWQRRVQKIILTASGGPFRGRDPATLKDVTPEQACAHPNWVMGRKISVDSATMMNKALEVIEARYLFGMKPDQMEVVIHPQSVIHSMVQYQDNSVVAQLGTPDMRVPIAYGLSWPERMTSGASALDFHALAAMTFEAMDDHGHPERFPGLNLAWETLNGAHIRFDQIHAVNRATLDRITSPAPQNLDDLMDLDRRGREAAKSIVQSLSV
ncbi:MAG: 1-deoxy-D-xylulose-5-phosphate reductoisomerase [Comamonadaceae bacterium PBBC2]|nr:MAG: 1-deoxy-D-xylulose-5-phosphate reductoisomerase [Comamonadaceae bacterium PBBC2]